MRTTMSGVICKNKSRMGDTTLRRILMIPCDILWNNQLKSIRSIAILGNSRGRVDGRGDTL